jgi:hypothetical protein
MRIVILLLTLILSSCTSEKKPFEIPKQTEGGWKLTATESVQAPEWMTRLGMKKASKARYTGPIDTEVEFYELNSEPAALECMQLWRGDKAESRFFKGNFFVVIRTTHPNREILMDFTRSVQKAL